MGEAKRRREFEVQKPHERLGDAPVEAQYHDQMTAIVRVLDEMLNMGKRGAARETGFVLMVFPFGSHDGRCNYMSNGADRKDVTTLMREMIARFEGQPELKGTA
jgi:hypothetical protein